MPSGGPSPIGIAAISASRIRRAGCGWGGSALLPPRHPTISRNVFNFSAIQDVHDYMNSNKAIGKIVVKLEKV